MCPPKGRLTVGSAAALVTAAALALLAPPAPKQVTTTQGPFPVVGDAGAGTAQVALAADAGAAALTIDTDGVVVAGTSTLTVTGQTVLSAHDITVTATTFDGNPLVDAVDAAANGLSTGLTAGRIVALNDGRLPVGIRSGTTGQTYPATYTDIVTPTIAADRDSGIVIGLSLRTVGTVQVQVPGRSPVQVGPRRTRP